MTLDNLIRAQKSRLTAIYDAGEADWLIRTLFENLKGWNRVELIVRGSDEVSEFTAEKVNEIVERLLNREPIQYIFGTTYWHGMDLTVTPDVLIPRPETSELVDLIVSQNQQTDLDVLDVCTGSGCIAVALAVNLNFPNVKAIDISVPALKVARNNAAARKVKIDFREADALKPLPYPDSSFDIIVSNPPYIAESERSAMDANVLDHEPHLALFVPDSDPLRFYTAIADSALCKLRPGGRLYFEINPLFASQLRNYLQATGWQDVTIIRDIHKRERFTSAVCPA